MTFEEYVVAVTRALLDNPTWRVGQTWFNVLVQNNFALAGEIRGTSLDPFYDDSVLSRFATRVNADWDEYAT